MGNVCQPIYLCIYTYTYIASICYVTAMIQETLECNWQNRNNRIETDSHTGIIHSNSCTDPQSFSLRDAYLAATSHGIRIMCLFYPPHRSDYFQGQLHPFCSHSLCLPLPLHPQITQTAVFISSAVTPLYCPILQKVGFFCDRRHFDCQLQPGS